MLSIYNKKKRSYSKPPSYKRATYKKRTLPWSQYKTSSQYKPIVAYPLDRGLSAVKICPDTMRVKLDYTYRTFTPTTIPKYHHILRGNSVHDPDFSITGNPSATGHNAWSMLYSKYRVLGSSVKVSIMNGAADYSGYFNYVVVPSNSSTTTLQFLDWSTNPFSKTGQCATGNTPPFNQVIYHKMDTAKICGVSDISTEANFTSLVSTNPNTVWYWHFYMEGDLTQPSIGLGCMLVFEITYDVEYFLRNPLLTTE